jgi:hypothetical protein
MTPRTLRYLPLVAVLALLFLHAAACSSSSTGTLKPPMGDAAAASDTNVAFDAAQNSDAPYVMCGGMTCQRGDICVEDQLEGGAALLPDDAGNCPGSSVLSDAGGMCVNPPTYHCKGLPAACSGTLTCACAASLCDPNYPCMGATGLTLSCVLQAP